MKRLVVASIALTGFLLATSIQAATFLVPTDQQLVANADAVVEGTCIGSWVRSDDRGRIETIYQIAVDQQLKGTVGETTIEVVEPGGHSGRAWLVVPGAPRYAPGERYVVVLDRRSDRRWTTSGLTLGRFHFEPASNGADLLVRQAAAIHGWNTDGSVHRERARAAKPFVRFIRSVASGRPAVADYFVQDDTGRHVASEKSIHTNAISELTPGQRFNFDLADHPARIPDQAITWHIWGSIPGLDLPAAVEQGIVTWSTAPGSTVHYALSSVPASGDTWGQDGENRIIAGDPHAQVQGDFGLNSSVVAATFVGCSDCSPIEHNGETFYAITSADVVLNNGISSADLSQEKLVTAVTHELGHTLGFRHSDAAPADTAGCSENVPCSHDAVMNSTVVPGLDGVLQPWDEVAIRSIYGEGVGCTPIVLDQPPATVDVAEGDATTISINVYSYAPVSYQWYEQEPGQAAHPVPGAVDRTFTTPPVESSTSYWVRATSECGSVDSRASVIVAHSSRAHAVRRW